MSRQTGARGTQQWDWLLTRWTLGWKTAAPEIAPGGIERVTRSAERPSFTNWRSKFARSPGLKSTATVWCCSRTTQLRCLCCNETPVSPSKYRSAPGGLLSPTKSAIPLLKLSLHLDGVLPGARLGEMILQWPWPWSYTDLRMARRLSWTRSGGVPGPCCRFRRITCTFIDNPFEQMSNGNYSRMLSYSVWSLLSRLTCTQLCSIARDAASQPIQSLRVQQSLFTPYWPSNN